MHHIVLLPTVHKTEMTNLLLLVSLGGLLGASLLLRLALLQESLGDQDIILGRDGTRVDQIST